VSAAAAAVAVAPAATERAQARAARRRWMLESWLAASAVFHPGGGFAYLWLYEAEAEPPVGP
jgi:hypothetical protein